MATLLEQHQAGGKRATSWDQRWRGKSFTIRSAKANHGRTSRRVDPDRPTAAMMRVEAGLVPSTEPFGFATAFVAPFRVACVCLLFRTRAPLAVVDVKMGSGRAYCARSAVTNTVGDARSGVLVTRYCPPEKEAPCVKWHGQIHGVGRDGGMGGLQQFASAAPAGPASVGLLSAHQREANIAVLRSASVPYLFSDASAGQGSTLCRTTQPPRSCTQERATPADHGIGTWRRTSIRCQPRVEAAWT